jgi:DNA-binding transcriptional MerR regulator
VAGDELWTLSELSDRVADELAVGYDGQSSGRVRELPNSRTIRWYTTIGLVDRPAAMHGRTAMYARRHLLQLVAVKRLQAAGQALADIQGQLLGAADELLERIAVPPQSVSQSVSRPGRFWAAAPAAAGDSAAGDSADSAAGHDSDTVNDAVAARVHGIRLNDTVTVLLGATRAPTDDEIAAIEAAAAPLLDLLHGLGLNEGETDDHAR